LAAGSLQNKARVSRHDHEFAGMRRDCGVFHGS
jgi:hypothetical protein